MSLAAFYPLLDPGGTDADFWEPDALKDHHTLIFILSYIAMVPCANLVGFAGQEFARKVPHVAGVLVETTYVFHHTFLYIYANNT